MHNEQIILSLNVNELNVSVVTLGIQSPVKRPGERSGPVVDLDGQPAICQLSGRQKYLDTPGAHAVLQFGSLCNIASHIFGGCCV